jgi:hypothetical protein
MPVYVGEVNSLMNVKQVEDQSSAELVSAMGESDVRPFRVSRPLLIIIAAIAITAWVAYFFLGGLIVHLAIVGTIATILVMGLALAEFSLWIRSRVRFPRTIRASTTTIVVYVRGTRRTYPVHESFWFVGDTKQDADGILLTAKRAIVLVLPDSNRVSIPFDSVASLCAWKSTLSAGHAKKLPDLTTQQERRFYATHCCIGLTLGVTLGAIVDFAVCPYLLLAAPSWRLANSTTCAVSGALLGIVFAGICRIPTISPAIVLFNGTLMVSLICLACAGGTSGHIAESTLVYGACGLLISLGAVILRNVVGVLTR